MHRIREVINVLNDFKTKREANRSRKEYLDLLTQDLCNYYSYNEFLMNKLIDLFPLAEVEKEFSYEYKKKKILK
jgi:ribosomal RNA methyltransferase Nop2